MDAQDVIYGSRAVHVRELQTELTKVKAENAALHARLESLEAHLDKALMAAGMLREGVEIELWDGWNLILGNPRVAKDRAELLAQAKASGKRVWIVFDGREEHIADEEGVLVSYTGGTGEHRADKYICDFLRMAQYLGMAERVTVRTNDKDFLKKIEKIRKIGGK